uniref:WW domain-containing protein n=1 Tax=Leptocylindrus danicus TaxID=163516 RepID=A0A7S2KH20_9STRA
MAGKGATASIIKQQGFIDSNPGFVNLDEHWRTEFRAYLFRIPPYYQQSIRRCLRPLLPQSVHALLAAETIDVIASQCFSRACLQKIRSGENIMKDHNERIDRQEEELRRHKVQSIVPECDGSQKVVGYGQYDPRTTVSAYLASLRSLPPPWRSGHVKVDSTNVVNDDEKRDKRVATVDEVDATKVLGDLPADCLLAYYESRRRWTFGGTGLTTKGLCVEGANYGGNYTHKYARDHKVGNESLLALSGVGASTINKTSISRMGNFRDRLLWSRSPVVGYGCNDSAGSAATTAPDGSSTWSVDDDVLPGPFFDPSSGDFVDSMQTRLHARLSINFGNPYKSKRGNCVIPEKFQSQRRPRHISGSFDVDEDNLPQTPQGSPPHGLTSPPHTLGSPPHDSFSVPAEGEGEAVFAGKPPTPRFSHNEPGKTATITPSKNFHKMKANKKPSETSLLKRKADDNQRGKSAGKPRPPPPPPKGSPTPSNQSRKKTSPRQQHRKGEDAPKLPCPPAVHERKPPAPAKKEKPPAPTKVEKPPAPAKIEKPPAPSRLDDPSKMRKLQQQPNPPPPDLQNPNVKPNVNLAPGWITVWSKSQKRWYFFDTKTNKSVWQWPPP